MANEESSVPPEGPSSDAADPPDDNPMDNASSAISGPARAFCGEGDVPFCDVCVTEKNSECHCPWEPTTPDKNTPSNLECTDTIECLKHKISCSCENLEHITPPTPFQTPPPSDYDVQPSASPIKSNIECPDPSQCLQQRTPCSCENLDLNNFPSIAPAPGYEGKIEVPSMSSSSTPVPSANIVPTSEQSTLKPSESTVDCPDPTVCQELKTPCSCENFDANEPSTLVQDPLIDPASPSVQSPILKEDGIPCPDFKMCQDLQVCQIEIKGAETSCSCEKFDPNMSSNVPSDVPADFPTIPVQDSLIDSTPSNVQSSPIPTESMIVCPDPKMCVEVKTPCSCENVPLNVPSSEHSAVPLNIDSSLPQDTSKGSVPFSEHPTTIQTESTMVCPNPNVCLELKTPCSCEILEPDMSSAQISEKPSGALAQDQRTCECARLGPCPCDISNTPCACEIEPCKSCTEDNCVCAGGKQDASQQQLTSPSAEQPIEGFQPSQEPQFPPSEVGEAQLPSSEISVPPSVTERILKCWEEEPPLCDICTASKIEECLCGEASLSKLEACIPTTPFQPSSDNEGLSSASSETPIASPEEPILSTSDLNVPAKLETEPCAICLVEEDCVCEVEERPCPCEENCICPKPCLCTPSAPAEFFLPVPEQELIPEEQPKPLPDDQQPTLEELEQILEPPSAFATQPQEIISPETDHSEQPIEEYSQETPDVISSVESSTTQEGALPAHKTQSCTCTLECICTYTSEDPLQEGPKEILPDAPIPFAEVQYETPSEVLSSIQSSTADIAAPPADKTPSCTCTLECICTYTKENTQVSLDAPSELTQIPTQSSLASHVSNGFTPASPEVEAQPIEKSTSCICNPECPSEYYTEVSSAAPEVEAQPIEKSPSCICISECTCTYYPDAPEVPSATSSVPSAATTVPNDTMFSSETPTDLLGIIKTSDDEASPEEMIKPTETTSETTSILPPQVSERVAQIDKTPSCTCTLECTCNEGLSTNITQDELQSLQVPSGVEPLSEQQTHYKTEEQLQLESSLGYADQKMLGTLQQTPSCTCTLECTCTHVVSETLASDSSPQPSTEMPSDIVTSTTYDTASNLNAEAPTVLSTLGNIPITTAAKTPSCTCDMECICTYDGEQLALELPTQSGQEIQTGVVNFSGESQESEGIQSVPNISLTEGGDSTNIEDEIHSLIDMDQIQLTGDKLNSGPCLAGAEHFQTISLQEAPRLVSGNSCLCCAECVCSKSKNQSGTENGDYLMETSYKWSNNAGRDNDKSESITRKDNQYRQAEAESGCTDSESGVRAMKKQEEQELRESSLQDSQLAQSEDASTQLMPSETSDPVEGTTSERSVPIDHSASQGVCPDESTKVKCPEPNECFQNTIPCSCVLLGAPTAETQYRESTPSGEDQSLGISDTTQAQQIYARSPAMYTDESLCSLCDREIAAGCLCRLDPLGDSQASLPIPPTSQFSEKDDYPSGTQFLSIDPTTQSAPAFMQSVLEEPQPEISTYADKHAGGDESLCTLCDRETVENCFCRKDQLMTEPETQLVENSEVSTTYDHIAGGCDECCCDARDGEGPCNKGIPKGARVQFCSCPPEYLEMLSAQSNAIVTEFDIAKMCAPGKCSPCICEDTSLILRALNDGRAADSTTTTNAQEGINDGTGLCACNGHCLCPDDMVQNPSATCNCDRCICGSKCNCQPDIAVDTISQLFCKCGENCICSPDNIQIQSGTCRCDEQAMCLCGITCSCPPENVQDENKAEEARSEVFLKSETLQTLSQEIKTDISVHSEAQSQEQIPSTQSTRVDINIICGANGVPYCKFCQTLETRIAQCRCSGDTLISSNVSALIIDSSKHQEQINDTPARTPPASQLGVCVRESEPLCDVCKAELIAECVCAQTMPPHSEDPVMPPIISSPSSHGSSPLTSATGDSVPAKCECDDCNHVCQDDGSDEPALCFLTNPVPICSPSENLPARAPNDHSEKCECDSRKCIDDGSDDPNICFLMNPIIVETKATITSVLQQEQSLEISVQEPASYTEAIPVGENMKCVCEICGEVCQKEGDEDPSLCFLVQPQSVQDTSGAGNTSLEPAVQIAQSVQQPDQIGISESNVTTKCERENCNKKCVDENAENPMICYVIQPTTTDEVTVSPEIQTTTYSAPEDVGPPLATPQSNACEDETGPLCDVCKTQMLPDCTCHSTSSQPLNTLPNALDETKDVNIVSEDIRVPYCQNCQRIKEKDKNYKCSGVCPEQVPSDIGDSPASTPNPTPNSVPQTSETNVRVEEAIAITSHTATPAGVCKTQKITDCICKPTSKQLPDIPSKLALNETGVSDIICGDHGIPFCEYCQWIKEKDKDCKCSGDQPSEQAKPCCPLCDVCETEILPDCTCKVQSRVGLQTASSVDPTAPNPPSTQATLPTAPSVVSTLPTAPSTVSTVPTAPSTVSTQLTATSTHSTLPTAPSTVSTIPTAPSTVSTIPTAPSTVSTIPTAPSTVSTIPTAPSTVSTIPTAPSTVSTIPTAPSTHSTLPTEPSTVSTVPTGPVQSDTCVCDPSGCDCRTDAGGFCPCEIEEPCICAQACVCSSEGGAPTDSTSSHLTGGSDTPNEKLARQQIVPPEGETNSSDCCIPECTPCTCDESEESSPPVMCSFVGVPNEGSRFQISDEGTKSNVSSLVPKPTACGDCGPCIEEDCECTKENESDDKPVIFPQQEKHILTQGQPSEDKFKSEPQLIYGKDGKDCVCTKEQEQDDKPDILQQQEENIPLQGRTSAVKFEPSPQLICEKDGVPYCEDCNEQKIKVDYCSCTSIRQTEKVTVGDSSLPKPEDVKLDIESNVALHQVTQQATGAPKEKSCVCSAPNEMCTCDTQCREFELSEIPGTYVPLGKEVICGTNEVRFCGICNTMQSKTEGCSCTTDAMNKVEKSGEPLKTQSEISFEECDCDEKYGKCPGTTDTTHQSEKSVEVIKIQSEVSFEECDCEQKYGECPGTTDTIHEAEKSEEATKTQSEVSITNCDCEEKYGKCPGNTPELLHKEIDDETSSLPVTQSPLETHITIDIHSSQSTPPEEIRKEFQTEVSTATAVNLNASDATTAAGDLTEPLDANIICGKGDEEFCRICNENQKKVEYCLCCNDTSNPIPISKEASNKEVSQFDEDRVPLVGNSNALSNQEDCVCSKEIQQHSTADPEEKVLNKDVSELTCGKDGVPFCSSCNALPSKVEDCKCSEETQHQETQSTADPERKVSVSIAPAPSQPLTTESLPKDGSECLCDETYGHSRNDNIESAGKEVDADRTLISENAPEITSSEKSTTNSLVETKTPSFQTITCGKDNVAFCEECNVEKMITEQCDCENKAILKKEDFGDSTIPDTHIPLHVTTSSAPSVMQSDAKMASPLPSKTETTIDTHEEDCNCVPEYEMCPCDDECVEKRRKGGVESKPSTKTDTQDHSKQDRVSPSAEQVVCGREECPLKCNDSDEEFSLCPEMTVEECICLIVKQMCECFEKDERCPCEASSDEISKFPQSQTFTDGKSVGELKDRTSDVSVAQKSQKSVPQSVDECTEATVSTADRGVGPAASSGFEKTSGVCSQRSKPKTESPTLTCSADEVCLTETEYIDTKETPPISESEAEDQRERPESSVSWSTPSKLQATVQELMGKCELKDNMIDCLLQEFARQGNASHVYQILECIASGRPPCGRPVRDYTRTEVARALARAQPSCYCTCACDPVVNTCSCGQCVCDCGGAGFLSTCTCSADGRSPAQRCVNCFLNFRVVRRVSEDGVIVRWDAPGAEVRVCGYEVFVDGAFRYRARSSRRDLAFINGLDLRSRHVFTLYALTCDPQECLQPAQAVYEPILSEHTDRQAKICPTRDDNQQKSSRCRSAGDQVNKKRGNRKVRVKTSKSSDAEMGQ